MNRMDRNALINRWKKDEAAPFAGWDFSYIEDRKRETKPPWNYQDLARELIKEAQSLLDMGTGGGEVLASLAPLPKHTIATEGYRPNVAVAQRRLKELGVQVIEADESKNLPVESDSFGLILNRHSAFAAPELERVLQAGGHFLTQQVSGEDLNDLVNLFDEPPRPKWTLEVASRELTQAGLMIQDTKQWQGKMEFTDLGALAYYLKAVPWVINDFSVERFADKLLDLQKRLDSGHKLEFTRASFLIRAHKP